MIEKWIKIEVKIGSKSGQKGVRRGSKEGQTRGQTRGQKASKEVQKGQNPCIARICEFPQTPACGFAVSGVILQFFSDFTSSSGSVSRYIFTNSLLFSSSTSAISCLTSFTIWLDLSSRTTVFLAFRIRRYTESSVWLDIIDNGEMEVISS